MKIFCDVFHISKNPSVSATHCQLLLSGPFCHFVTFPHSMGNHPFQGSLISLLLCKTRRTVANVPPERFQNQGVTNGTQGRSGLVRSALEKLSLFSPTCSVCPEVWARGISLSADSNLEGTCPLRTPRQLRSAGAA